MPHTGAIAVDVGSVLYRYARHVEVPSGVDARLLNGLAEVVTVSNHWREWRDPRLVPCVVEAVVDRTVSPEAGVRRPCGVFAGGASARPVRDRMLDAGVTVADLVQPHGPDDQRAPVAAPVRSGSGHLSSCPVQETGPSRPAEDRPAPSVGAARQRPRRPS